MKKTQQILSNKISLKSNRYWLPENNNYIVNHVHSNSWFDIKEKISTTKNEDINKNLTFNTKTEVKQSKKIKIYPNELQKKILIHWMNCYIKMYNKTICLFKKARFHKEQIPIQYTKLRTYYLKSTKDEIIKNSQICSIKQNTKVNSHVLDFAIQNACSIYKSCLTKMKNKTITHFRLRYLKMNKPNKIIKIEKASISKKWNTFCSTVFTEEFNTSNFKLSSITSDFLIQYKKDEFYIIYTDTQKIKKIHDKKDTCGIDQGIRTFMTCYSNNKIIAIGNNIKEKIKKNISKIDSIKTNEKIKENKKKKLENKYYEKITNYVTDLHWKSINYVTKEYGNIVIGKLSTKSISNNKKSKIDPLTKRVAYSLCFYKFRERLKYKCELYKIGYKEINEAYTSKLCTACGKYNNKLEGNKIFKCPFCKIEIDRDEGGSRNMLLSL